MEPGAESSNPEVQAPDKTLAQLYKSARPPVDLIPGLSLSALINTAWLPSDAKAMLAESWIPVPAEPEEGAAPAPTPPAFDPKAVEYKEMMKRLAKSAPLEKWNSLTVQIKSIENDVIRTKDEKEIEALNGEAEVARAQLAETETQLTELKASFYDDPLSLVPWMQTLFDLVDAGLTSFEVGGPLFPHTTLSSLFGSNNNTSFYESSERVLGVFKRRCDRERGPGKVQVLTRLTPNIFQDGYSPTLIEPLVDKIRANIYGAETTEPLDFLQLQWWDPQDHDPLPTLKVLQRLSEDKLDVNEESGEVAITEPKKIRGLGLVDFPARSVLSAIQAGVPVVAVQIPFSIVDRSYGATLAMCREYNIKVFSKDGLLGGLISEKYLDAPCPETTQTDPDLDDVAHCIDMVNNYGGWENIQALLRLIKAIADKHSVKMQSVALRWQIDQGTFPMVSSRWGPACWRQFGFDYWRGATPGVDWQLFQVESFLDAEDMKLLNQLG
ncbi:hypothetical protein CEUSTIGMA_g7740.t1 [Chlamydomonas eustigma]|uniref:NADP-dependent oxidoreductase domain-containing protein n=1 Tax=Chlamydomonas eustigma TaxID=1157962 RepID=A0A250XBQ6_9CHLO|nr:hypothetical protein CEUSTIGMA_g7740.t1 [Chlamydomonas eustigma]|eukprot:GAX80302.1 hypothetical protein CEUSTIGMA_g7740.t1 [Chlamydomonas eustigma]